MKSHVLRKKCPTIKKWGMNHAWKKWEYKQWKREIAFCEKWSVPPHEGKPWQRQDDQGPSKGRNEQFLYSILVNVCKQLNDYPYTTIDYEMLKECIYPYTNIERINEEKKRILMHLDAIKADCDALAMDVEKSLKLKDTVENDFFADFSADKNQN